MFSLLVRRDGLIDPPDLGEFDAHCHILPGIDDGPTDERGTLAIARLLIEMGVKRVVATPHVISDVFPNSTKTIVEAAENVRQLLADSGLELREEYAHFDARRRLDLEIGPDYEPDGCRCGEVIQGRANPADCALFGTACTVEKPVGPCMVSSEGTCAAWYRYAGAVGK